jgi:hypothetical protein
MVAGEFGAATYDALADRFETGIVGGPGFAEMVPDSAGNLAILQTLDPRSSAFQVNLAISTGRKSRKNSASGPRAR